MKTTIVAYYSTITGNAIKLAEGIEQIIAVDNLCFDLKNVKDTNVQKDQTEPIVLFFWCRKGSLDPASQEFLQKCKNRIIFANRTEIRRNLPENHPHHLNEEGLKRHLESRKHPDRNDIEQAAAFLLEHLSR